MIAVLQMFIPVYATEAQSQELQLDTPSAILMEAGTGQIIYEKNSTEVLRPASITKIMTLLLIFDALDSGQIRMTDEVTVSAHAASMGGSQVYLEEGETQTVDTMIKCISMASANDACVSMAEYIAGSEDAFVQRMNERAQGLGMEQTHFVNCCGLDTNGHVSSAKDVAFMSRELIQKYPKIHEYSMVWMDTITHKTRKGTTEFGLTNTNKLIRQYEWATGLKTGSTGLAKCCLSATAKKDGVELIAVIMGAANSKMRFADAKTLLDYGFRKSHLYTDEERPQLEDIAVLGGKTDRISCEYEDDFSYLFINDIDSNQIEKEIAYEKNLQAPIAKGQVVGTITYRYQGNTLGTVNIVSLETIEKARFVDILTNVMKRFVFI